MRKIVWLILLYEREEGISIICVSETVDNRGCLVWVDRVLNAFHFSHST